jgi:hypothetical protein
MLIVLLRHRSCVAIPAKTTHVDLIIALAVIEPGEIRGVIWGDHKRGKNETLARADFLLLPKNFTRRIYL